MDIKHGKAYVVSKRYLLKKVRWIMSCPVLNRVVWTVL